MSTVNSSTGPPTVDNPRGKSLQEATGCTLGLVVVVVALRLWGRFRFTNGPRQAFSMRYGDHRFWVLLSDISIIVSTVSFAIRVFQDDGRSNSDWTDYGNGFDGSCVLLWAILHFRLARFLTNICSLLLGNGFAYKVTKCASKDRGSRGWISSLNMPDVSNANISSIGILYFPNLLQVRSRDFKSLDLPFTPGYLQPANGSFQFGLPNLGRLYHWLFFLLLHSNGFPVRNRFLQQLDSYQWSEALLL